MTFQGKAQTGLDSSFTAAFQHFDMHNVSSWPQIELWCAINGIEVTNSVFCFFMTGMIVSQKIRQIMLEYLFELQPNVEFIDDISTIATLKDIQSYIEGNIHSLSNLQGAYEWLKLNNGVDVDESPLTKKQTYQAIYAIGNAYPLLLVRLYINQ